MCMHCSQMCDTCKPAEMKAFVCESCSKATVLTRGDCLRILGYWKPSVEEAEGRTGGEGGWSCFCRHCGADLKDVVRSAVRPLACKYSGICCAYPCRRRERRRGAADGPCKKQVRAKPAPADAGRLRADSIDAQAPERPSIVPGERNDPKRGKRG